MENLLAFGLLDESEVGINDVLVDDDSITFTVVRDYITSFSWQDQGLPRSQSLVPLDQRSENESSGSNHFEITMEITEFCPSGLTQSASTAHAWNGCSQSSRFLPQARRIVGSGDENEIAKESQVNLLDCAWLHSHRSWEKQANFIACLQEDRLPKQASYPNISSFFLCLVYKTAGVTWVDGLPYLRARVTLTGGLPFCSCKHSR